MATREQPELALDHGSRGYRYFRNAVERHWDPHDIDLAADRERIEALDDVQFESLRRTLGLFGAGEQAVTEDLAPLAAVLEDVNDQLFVTTQLYEEAKHADFFDRYWGTVVHEEERRRGVEQTTPSDDRWFSEPYRELFERNDEAMARLLTADTPENRARAYCHYHLVIEGVLAQTGYYGVQTTFSDETPATPNLDGLVEGFRKIRGDEGRHVGFGMAKLKDLVESGAVSAAFLHDTVNELVPYTQGIVTESTDPDSAGPGEEELTEYAAERHTQRMEQIVDASSDIPDVQDLVKLAGD